MSYDVPTDHHQSTPAAVREAITSPDKVRSLISRLHAAAGPIPRATSLRPFERDLMMEAASTIAALGALVAGSGTIRDEHGPVAPAATASGGYLRDLWRRLVQAGGIGADLSPGDALCREAAVTIRDMIGDDEDTPPRGHCATCRYFNQQGMSLDVPYGECRRHAPITAADEDSGIWFPSVSGQCWCGDHRLR